MSRGFESFQFRMVKAKWPLSERADDLEKAKGYQKEAGKDGDTREQTDSKPCAKKGQCK